MSSFASPAPTASFVRFVKTEIDRAHLYGVRKLVALDAAGRECQTALLARDGRYVLHGAYGVAI